MMGYTHIGSLLRELLDELHTKICQRFLATRLGCRTAVWVYKADVRSVQLLSKSSESADPLRAVERVRVLLLNIIYIYYMHIY